jgi:hypothetical protein
MRGVPPTGKPTIDPPPAAAVALDPSRRKRDIWFPQPLQRGDPMNLSHAYSDHAPKPKSYVGIGLVVAIHLAAIYALSAGLIKTPVTPQGPITVKPLPDVVEPPPPVEKRQLDKPTFKDVPVVHVPVPEIVIDRDYTLPPILTRTISDDQGPRADWGPAKEITPPTTTKQPAIQTPGAVCAVMPKPDLPALNWTGEAVLNVIATVRGGRVVGTEFRVTQGALDSKTKRSLQRAAEAALAGYQCQGDAMFQQDFAFRLD